MDMQKQACTDTAYTSSPISGTSSLTLCKMADLESTKFELFSFYQQFPQQNLLIAPAVVSDVSTPYPIRNRELFGWKNESGSWRSLLLKSFKRGSFSSINLCKKQEGIVFLLV